MIARAPWLHERLDRSMKIAIVAGVLVHLLFFAVIRVAPAVNVDERVAAPSADYILQQPGAVSGAEGTRTLWSPVLFALPTEMGFSRSVMKEPLRTRLVFNKEGRPERYLAGEITLNDPVLRVGELKTLSSGAGMLTLPDLPAVFSPQPAERVYMAPGLRARQSGGITLPETLNVAPEVAWQAGAYLSVAADGLVRHVLLERPTGDAELDQELIKALYRLSFRAEDRGTEGRVDIFSVAPAVDEVEGAE